MGDAKLQFGQGAPASPRVHACGRLDLPHPAAIRTVAAESYPTLLLASLPFERLAAEEHELKAHWKGQARAYRKLAAERAEKFGLSPPSLPGS